MANTKTLVSVEEYLSTVYDPDCDYVDGEVEERNMGEKEHSRLQGRLVRRIPENFAVFPEVRIQVTPTRFRVPDVCAYLEEPEEQIFTTPPFLVIEILSPEDRMSRMQRKLEDYYQMGCRNVWVLDPWRRKAFQYDGAALNEVNDRLTTQDARISLALSELFS